MAKDLVDGVIEEMIMLLEGMTTVKAIRSRNKVNLAVLKKIQSERDSKYAHDATVDRTIPQPERNYAPQERKDYFHTECFVVCKRREHELGYNVTDLGSPEIIANLPGRCKECGGIINPGHKIVCRRLQERV